MKQRVLDGTVWVTLLLAPWLAVSCGDAQSSVDIAGTHGRLEHAQMLCFYGADDPTTPAATIEFRLETFDLVDSLRARLTLDPRFVDNTYGLNAIGWQKDHSFDQLVGSDHAQLIFSDEAQQDVLDIKMDYLSKDDTAPSGFGTLGVVDGDGKVALGETDDILRVETSLDANLNQRNYGEFTTDSPLTDTSYDPNPDAPEWDYRVVYDVWVADGAFGPNGFGAVRLDFVHASPSKTGTNSVDVEESSCPDDWCPGGCENLPGDDSGGAGSSGEDGPTDTDSPLNDAPA